MDPTSEVLVNKLQRWIAKHRNSEQEDIVVVVDVEPDNLPSNERYWSITRKVETILEDNYLDDYQFILNCNVLLVDIENQINATCNFIRGNYKLKFPELESVVHNPIDYARVVKKIGNEVDLAHVDLQGLLPSSVIMVVSIVASTTSGKPLPEEDLGMTMEACERALALDTSKNKVLGFVESRMERVAPNLSAVVGSAVAAKLMGKAGGLSRLARMPACNVQFLGAKWRNSVAGFWRGLDGFPVGHIEKTEIFQSTPPSLRMRTCRLLAAKSTLAARVDSGRGDPSGKMGMALRDEVLKRIERWQEPPPAKLCKPLQVTDCRTKKRRGGRRLRKRNERYAMTDARRRANRMQFGVQEESS